MLLRLLLSVPVLAMMTLTIGTSFNVFLAHKRVAAIQAGDADLASRADALLAERTVNHSPEWIATATQLSAEAPTHDAQSIELLERALDEDPTRPKAWALLSYLYARRDGAFSPAAKAALQVSLEACGYCDHDLLEWRFNFVLQNWKAAPEPIRIAVFSGADFLRWWHLEYEYLRAVRTEAIALGIPFDTYRRRVGTHIRPNEL